jgi:hypothetical protein
LAFLNKTILLFLLKLIVISGLLFAPVSFFDTGYGKFYRANCRMLFHHFLGTGIGLYNESKDAKTTNIQIGNLSLLDKNKQLKAGSFDVNTRYRGYIPTVLLISLVLASPVPWKRRLFALIAGLILITAFIMLKQWIHLVFICQQIEWLKMDDFSARQKSITEFVYLNYINTIGPSLFVTVVVWLVVTFRIDDLKKFSLKKTEI